MDKDIPKEKKKPPQSITALHRKTEREPPVYDLPLMAPPEPKNKTGHQAM